MYGYNGLWLINMWFCGWILSDGLLFWFGINFVYWFSAWLHVVILNEIYFVICSIMIFIFDFPPCVSVGMVWKTNRVSVTLWQTQKDCSYESRQCSPFSTWGRGISWFPIYCCTSIQICNQYENVMELRLDYWDISVYACIWASA